MNKHEYLSDSLRATLAELDTQTDLSLLAATLIKKLSEPFTPHILWQYRPYLYRLPEDVRNQSPVLLTAMSAIAALEGDIAATAAFIDRLPENSHYRIYAQLFSPFLTWSEHISVAKQVLEHNLGPIPNLTLTAGRPYVLNGYRDFSPALNTLRNCAEQSIPLFEAMYGTRSRNAITIALAEAQYMRDERFEALASVVGTLPFLSQETDAQLLFPALYLEMLIMVMTGQVSALEPMIKHLRDRLQIADRSEWLPNIDALEAHSALYTGDYAKVALWMRKCAPDEYGDFCSLDLYRYMVKLRVYIVQQKPLAFYALASKLLPLLQAAHRPMDECELQMLMSIAAYHHSYKDRAIMHAERMLQLAENYRYDRLLADEGEQLLHVLLLYRRERGNTPYLSRVISLTRKTASFYPRYLKPQLPESPALSDAELVVLRFLADGRSNADIAELLDVQVDTVKAHCKHIAKKLQTQNRHQAVTRAIELGILEPHTPGTPFPISEA